MVNRYYDPSTDQFLSVDPAVATTGQPYAFTGDDPLNATDPLGLSTNWIERALRSHGRWIKGGRRSPKFPNSAEPHEVLYRTNENGITSYQAYDEHGHPIIRVDLQGSPHGPVETPHVVEFQKNTNPATGVTRYQEKSGLPRAATPSEIPSESFQQSLVQADEVASEGVWQRTWGAFWDNGSGGDAGDDG